MDIFKLFAKSDNTTLLIDHSKTISENTLLVKNKFLSKTNFYEKTGGYLSHLSDAGLLHDIGKSTIIFQNFLHREYRKTKNNTTINYNDVEENTKFKFCHNEVGWAFLRTYTNISELTCKLIYWHHNIYYLNYQVNASDILKQVSEEDIETMKNLVEYLKPGSLLKEMRDPLAIKSPNFYSSYSEENINNNLCDDAEFLTTLSYLITADTRNLDLDKLIYKKEITDFKIPYENSIRFQTQYSISQNQNLISAINAPAGFGKSIVGLLWSLRSNRRLIWVCPRNFIAESVYKSVLEEMNVLGINPSISLIYSNEIKASNVEIKNNENLSEMFKTDIVIVNIDTYLRYNYELGNIHVLMNVLNADVIFDEYHENVSDYPGFALMVKIVKARCLYGHGKTINLSATGIDYNFLWDKTNLMTYLPEKNKHYNPVHDNVYKLNKTINFVPESIDNNSIHIKNSINGAQKLTVDTKHEKLIHSKFEENDRKIKYDEIYYLYGKKVKLDNKPGYIGTHIVQASLDVSFNKLIEDVLSPYSTLQRIGRCDRFGNLIDCEITINFNESESNNVVTEILYNIELRDLWFNFVVDNTTDKITLKEFYELFNNFHTKYETKIKQYIREIYKTSSDALSKNIFPIKMSNNAQIDKENMKANSHILRCKGNELWFTCEKEDGLYMQPMTQEVYRKDYKSVFKEDGNAEKKIRRFISEQSKSPSNNMDFSKYKGVPKSAQLWHMDNIRLNAMYKKTPYFAYNLSYNSLLGVHPKNEKQDHKLNLLD